MNFPSCIDVAFCIRLVVTLGHFLWQATAIAVLAWLAGALLSEATSRLRYGCWFARCWSWRLVPS